MADCSFFEKTYLLVRTHHKCLNPDYTYDAFCPYLWTKCVISWSLIYRLRTSWWWRKDTNWTRHRWQGMWWRTTWSDSTVERHIGVLRLLQAILQYETSAFRNTLLRCVKAMTNRSFQGREYISFVIQRFQTTDCMKFFWNKWHFFWDLFFLL